MAHSEACQLFIEEQIKEGLDAGKTPYSIGKELTAMIEKYFEASIPPRTLEQRARRTLNATNVAPLGTTLNSSENPEKQNKQQVTKRQQEPGPGRSLKYAPAPTHIFDAINFATIAISQLERIKPDDPKRDEALLKVKKWIENNL